MNHIMIAGHLAADLEVRFTPSGLKVTTARVAVNNRRGKNEETLWWRVTFWGEAHDKILSYMKKGSAVIISGDMSKPEIYTSKNGQPQISLNMTAHNVTFSPFGRTGGTSSDQQTSAPSQGKDDPFAGMGGNEYGQVMQGQAGVGSNTSFSDDEIPF